MHPYRTHTCNELRAGDAGKTARLSGWVFRKRDHGGILFIDLRDHYGLTQVVVHPSRPFFGEVEKVKLESVLTFTGQVVLREPATVNPELPTGEVELVADACVVESPSETTPLYIPYVREQAGKEDYPDVRSVIFMGGGDTTLQALRNLPDYMHAKVIEADEAQCYRLGELLKDRRHVLIIHGDGRDLDLLKDEGIETTQAFAALTGSAEANILACLAAKRLGVRKTVARVESSDYISMAESLDIGSIVNKKTIAAGHIYQMMLKADVTNVKCLTVAKADVAEFVAAEGSKVTRRPVRDLGLPDTVTLGGLVRGGRGYLINGMTQIQAGDTVMAFCLDNAIKKLERYFN